MRWQINCHARLDSGEHQHLPVGYQQGKHGVEIRIESVNKDNSHSWVRISHELNKLVTDLIDNKNDDDDEQETSTTKTEVFSFASRKTEKTHNCLHIFKDCKYSWKNMDWYWTTSSIRSRVPSGKKTKHSSSARRITSRRRWRDRILETGLRNQCQLVLSILVCRCMEEQDGRTREQQDNAVLIRQDKKFTSEIWKVIQDAIPLILHCKTMCWSEQLLRVNLSYWLCSQFTLQKFRSDSGRTKF